MYYVCNCLMSICTYAVNGDYACISKGKHLDNEAFSDNTQNTVLITKQETPDSIFDDLHASAGAVANVVTAYVKLIQFIRSRDPQIGSAYRAIAKAGGYIHTCIYVLAYVLSHHDAGQGADGACARVLASIYSNTLSHAYQTWLMGIGALVKCGDGMSAMQCVVAKLKTLPIFYNPAPYYASFGDLLNDYDLVARNISLSDQYQINGV